MSFTTVGSWNISAASTAQPLIYVHGTTPFTTALPVTSPPPAPAVPKRSAFDRLRALIRREDVDFEAKLAALPTMAGAAPEAETERDVELIHRKKITLKRLVGSKRPDVKGGTPTHTGTVELVRTLSGLPHLTDTIGIKATGDSSGFVEVPVEDLLAAVEELRDSIAPDAPGK